MALVESQDLVEHVVSATSAPPEFENSISGAFGSIKLDPTLAFLQWRKFDCLLRGWIIGTLLEEVQGLVVGLDTAHQV